MFNESPGYARTGAQQLRASPQCGCNRLRRGLRAAEFKRSRGRSECQRGELNALLEETITYYRRDTIGTNSRRVRNVYTWWCLNMHVHISTAQRSADERPHVARSAHPRRIIKYTFQEDSPRANVKHAHRIIWRIWPNPRRTLSTRT